MQESSFFRRIGKNEKYNVGIALLRLLMCFQVVACHFYSFEGTGFFNAVLSEYSSLAVPAFMILSFLFIDIFEVAHSDNKIKKRIRRLVVPYVFWATVYFFLYWILDKAYGYSLGIHRGIKGFVALLITGNMLNTAAWFMVDLIVLTAIFLLLARVFDYNIFMWCVILLSISSLILQYTGIWYSIVDTFFKNTPFYWTVGRLMEMIPMVAMGVILNKMEVLKKLSKIGIQYTISLVVVVFILFFLVSKMELLSLSNDFMYGGIDRIIKAVMTIIVFDCFRIENISSSIANIIILLSKHTMAVFYMHNLIGTILFRTGIAEWMGLSNGTVGACIVIYTMCIIIAFAMSKAPVKIIRESMM